MCDADLMATTRRPDCAECHKNAWFWSVYPSAIHLPAVRRAAVIGWFRSWLAGFGHPGTTTMLPDPVTWTVPVRMRLVGEGFDQLVQRINGEEDHTDDGDDKWHLVCVVETYEGATVRLRRTDGAYRWRDDGFKGY